MVRKVRYRLRLVTVESVLEFATVGVSTRHGVTMTRRPVCRGRCGSVTHVPDPSALRPLRVDRILGRTTHLDPWSKSVKPKLNKIGVLP